MTERGEGDPETNLLPFETIQLNDSTIAGLNDLYPDDAKIFDFGDASSAGPSVVPETGCKAFPDESHWPSQDQWSLLASLTEEALIKGEPSAAVCYEDWPQYDAGDCASVTGKWGSPKFQYAYCLGCHKLSRHSCMCSIRADDQIGLMIQLE